jgi:hypothetical protein
MFEWNVCFQKLIDYGILRSYTIYHYSLSYPLLSLVMLPKSRVVYIEEGVSLGTPIESIKVPLVRSPTPFLLKVIHVRVP